MEADSPSLDIGVTNPLTTIKTIDCIERTSPLEFQCAQSFQGPMSVGPFCFSLFPFRLFFLLGI